MSLRLKLILAFVSLSAVATIGLGTWTYAATSSRLHHEIDESLRTAAAPLVTRLGGDAGWVAEQDGGDDNSRPGRGNMPGIFDRPRSYEQILVQLIADDGEPVVTPPSGELPIGGPERAVASGDATPTLVRNVDLDRERYRLLTVAVPGGAIQLARSLDETDRLLGAIRNRTLVAVGLVTAAAAVLGSVIARQATRRLVTLTETAEAVASTGRLDISVPVAGADEAGRLGEAFNSMLAALASSREDQHRLVQDAGHELRTPLTSLRTNVSVLRRYDQLPDEVRGQVLDDVESEAKELTALVNELVELATDRRNDEPVEELVLQDVVTSVVDRARRRSNRTVLLVTDDSRIAGRRSALERAVSNLVENAAKFDQSDAPIEVTVRGGRVQVDDRGPGVPDADLPHLFERFYRAVDARSRPGSGLGLAIVQDIVTNHGGQVFAANRIGGGASIGFVLPEVAGSEPS